jgi:hypothetical protein
MLISPEVVEAAATGEGLRRGLPLAGWEEKSVWGWDSADRSLFAQMYRNGEDDWDPPPGNRWITVTRYPATGSVEQLAQWIAQATGAADSEVLLAMADSLGGQAGGRLRALADAA